MGRRASEGFRLCAWFSVCTALIVVTGCQTLSKDASKQPKAGVLTETTGVAAPTANPGSITSTQQPTRSEATGGAFDGRPVAPLPEVPTDGGGIAVVNSSDPSVFQQRAALPQEMAPPTAQVQVQQASRAPAVPIEVVTPASVPSPGTDIEQPIATATRTVPIPRPEASGYRGPASGNVVPAAILGKGETQVIQGQFPGVPVMIQVDTKEFAIVEPPGPSNGWNRVAVRSKNGKKIAAEIHWTVLK